MSIRDKNRVYDGWVSLEGGVDNGRSPETLDVNQCVSSENSTFRGGKHAPRPGVRKLTQQFYGIFSQKYCYGKTYVDGDLVTHVAGEYILPDVLLTALPPDVIAGQNTESVYENGKFQSAIAFSPHGQQDCIIAMIGGRMFQIIPGVTTALVSEIIPTSDDVPNLRNREDLSIAYQVQADKWAVAQDGVSKPIIYDGITARRTATTSSILKTEIPVGTILAFGMGRIVTVVNQRDVAFGDLFGSHSLPDAGDSLIFFTERNFLTEGFDAEIPFEKGVATGAAFFPQLDTSTGTGQLLCFSERSASSFFLNLPREVWKTSQFQILALLTTGLRGHRSISVVNEDLWFRADDGVRTYRQARSEPSGWAHIPLSTNVKQFVGNDSAWLLKYISSIYFDNRMIMTCSPMWNQGRVIHGGLIVMDFDIISSFGTRNKPAWEGHWTLPGVQITQVLTGSFNGVTRAFIFGVDSDGLNQLYELSLDDANDWDDQPVVWENVSRAFDFTKLSQQSSPFSETELYDADLWISGILNQGSTIQAFYRPDNYPSWIDWKTFTQELDMIGVPSALDLGGEPTVSPGFSPRLSFEKPPDATDPTTKRNLRRGYQFQVKLKGTGHVVIDRFRIHAQKLIERSRAK